MRQIYKGKKKLCLSLLLRVRPKVNGSRPNRGAPVFPSPGRLLLALALPCIGFFYHRPPHHVPCLYALFLLLLRF